MSALRLYVHCDCGAHMLQLATQPIKRCRCGRGPLELRVEPVDKARSAGRLELLQPELFEGAARWVEPGETPFQRLVRAGKPLEVSGEQADRIMCCECRDRPDHMWVSGEAVLHRRCLHGILRVAFDAGELALADMLPRDEYDSGGYCAWDPTECRAAEEGDPFHGYAELVVGGVLGAERWAICSACWASSEFFRPYRGQAGQPLGLVASHVQPSGPETSA